MDSVLLSHAATGPLSLSEAVWFWIPMAIVVIALGVAAVYLSPVTVPHLVLPLLIVLGTPTGVALIVQSDAAHLLVGLAPLIPPVVAAVVLLAVLRVSLFWAACVLVGSALVFGLFGAVWDGPKENPPVLIGWVTATVAFALMAAAAVFLSSAIVFFRDRETR